MVIQELKPSKRVQGRWLAVLEDGSILRLGENEIIDFALCAGKELTEEEAEGLMASLHRSGLKEKALSLLARKPQSRKELERKLSQWEATQEEAAAICERMAELIHTEFCIPTQQLTPELKDWNEDLCALQDIPNRGPEMRMG